MADTLVRGLKIPTNCAACPFRLVWCRERIYMETRPKRCPLYEVPKHGRLIDSDALFRRVKTECNPYGAPTISYEYGCKVLDMINNAPTIVKASEVENV